MTFKFEQLDVWKMSLEYSDLIYAVAERLPERERFNLQSQIIRAATSISLNIAEGSTGQSDPEQNRFLGLALRSLIETVACQRLISRRTYVTDIAVMNLLDVKAQELAKRIHAFRKSLKNPQKSISEEQAP
ncbi:MAG: four helix bundle protein, partial [Anaerolineales bacterium]|nr:four helix bundle protein [Anaerolineales bacterium]